MKAYLNPKISGFSRAILKYDAKRLRPRSVFTIAVASALTSVMPVALESGINGSDFKASLLAVSFAFLTPAFLFVKGLRSSGRLKLVKNEFSKLPQERYDSERSIYQGLTQRAQEKIRKNLISISRFRAFLGGQMDIAPTDEAAVAPPITAIPQEPEEKARVIRTMRFTQVNPQEIPLEDPIIARETLARMLNRVTENGWKISWEKDTEIIRVSLVDVHDREFREMLKANIEKLGQIVSNEDLSEKNRGIYQALLNLASGANNSDIQKSGVIKPSIDEVLGQHIFIAVEALGIKTKDIKDARQNLDPDNIHGAKDQWMHWVRQNKDKVLTAAGYGHTDAIWLAENIMNNLSDEATPPPAGESAQEPAEHITEPTHPEIAAAKSVSADKINYANDRTLTAVLGMLLGRKFNDTAVVLEGEHKNGNGIVQISNKTIPEILQLIDSGLNDIAAASQMQKDKKIFGLANAVLLIRGFLKGDITMDIDGIYSNIRLALNIPLMQNIDVGLSYMAGPSDTVAVNLPGINTIELRLLRLKLDEAFGGKIQDDDLIAYIKAKQQQVKRAVQLGNADAKWILANLPE